MKIKYYINEEECIEVEVNSQVAELHIELEQEEKRAHWRNKKRKDHSFDAIQEAGYIFPDATIDINSVVEHNEEKRQLMSAISKLSTENQELIFKLYFKGVTITQLAKDYGVTKSAISQRLSSIHKKLKKLLN